MAHDFEDDELDPQELQALKDGQEELAAKMEMGHGNTENAPANVQDQLALLNPVANGTMDPVGMPRSTSNEVSDYISKVYGGSNKAIADARAGRDSDARGSVLSMAAGNLGAALGGRGYNTVDTGNVEGAQKELRDVHAKEAAGDQDRLREQVGSFITNKNRENYQQALLGSRLAKQRELDSSNAEKADAKTRTEQDKAYTTLRKDLESFRGNRQAAQAAMDVYSASKALALVEGKDPNSLTTQDLSLLNNEIAKIATGGVPGEHGVTVLMPDNLRTRAAELQNFLLSKPTDAQAGEYVKKNIAYLREMTDVAKRSVGEYRGRLAKGYKNRVRPEDYQEALSDYEIPGETDQKKGAAFAPRQVRKGNSVATVSSKAELDEAMKEGWQ